MIYLSSFQLPSLEAEYNFFAASKMNVYSSYYPYGIFDKRVMPKFDLADITIFYGGNGSGKTTLLNVIAEAIGAERGVLYNKSEFFDSYAKSCDFQWEYGVSWQDAEVITSDDIFDYAMEIRRLNDGIDIRRDDLKNEYLDAKHSDFKLRSLDDYEELKRINEVRRGSVSAYIRKRSMENLPEKSNGETAFLYFTNKIKQNKIYILDEPENSMAAEFQLDLVKFIEDSARFFNCQFIIATHSPFLLASKMAEVYDLDSEFVEKKHWSRLANIRRYYDFFKEHEDEFKE